MSASLASPRDLDSASTAVSSGNAAQSLHKRPSHDPATVATEDVSDNNPAPSETPETPRRRGTGLSNRSGRSGRDGDAPAFTFRALGRKGTWVALVKPEKEVKGKPTYAQSVKRAITCSWLNVLLVFIPVSWGLHFAKVDDVYIFIFSLLAIIPLAKLLGEGTEEVALRVGNTLGGLLNATLGNATELIIAILALVKCELALVQSSLLGSILSNLLLVLGMCFALGGIRFSEQAFSITAAQLNSSLLTVSVIAVLVPAGFHAAFSDLNDAVEGPDVLKMSRGIAVILLVVYFAYLTFQLFTHSHLFLHGDNATHEGHTTWGNHKIMRPAKSVQATRGVGFGTPVDVENRGEGGNESEDEEEEEAQMNLVSALVLLVVSTVLIGVTSEWLVDSINGITSSGTLSTQWVGLILLPIVGNAAEHLTAVTTGYKDKMDISMGVAVGSSIQIALFVIPLLVVLAWIMDKPLTLLFDPFESVILFLAVLVVNYTIADGKTNWLEGLLLMMVYVIVAVAFFFYPAGAAEQTLGLECN